MCQEKIALCIAAIGTTLKGTTAINWWVLTYLQNHSCNFLATPHMFMWIRPTTLFLMKLVRNIQLILFRYDIVIICYYVIPLCLKTSRKICFFFPLSEDLLGIMIWKKLLIIKKHESLTMSEIHITVNSPLSGMCGEWGMLLTQICWLHEENSYRNHFSHDFHPFPVFSTYIFWLKVKTRFCFIFYMRFFSGDTVDWGLKNFRYAIIQNNTIR
jgi:hypothetical protein